MADTELKQSTVAAEAAASQSAQEKQPAKDTSKLLEAYGGFNAIRGFLPDADNLNPARKAAKNVFLSDKRFEDKRTALAKDIKAWLELLGEGHGTATEYVDSCKAKEQKCTAVLKQGITDAFELGKVWLDLMNKK